MNPLQPPLPQSLRYYATAPYPCSYLQGHTARSQVATPGHWVQHAVYSQLVREGFRRSGLFTYRPHCDHCHACLPLRIDAHRFQANRSQSRTWRHHAHLHIQVMEPVFNPEHYRLYLKYQRQRHPGGGMDDDNTDQYQQFLLQSRVRSQLVEFRAPTATGEAPLCMVSLIDCLDDGLSAVYTFYDPDTHTGLGTYNILWQIEQVRQLGLRYLYLGYWIAQSPKMAYKARFRPCQVLQNGQWQDLHHPA